jgi:hypothetical protein
MLMPGRNSNSNSYRYGMNGMEKDDEVNGVTGSSYTATFWQYDSRLMRRWNVDPVDKPWESSYAAFGGNPILNIDPNGDDWYKNNETQSVVWIESNGEPKNGYTFLGEHRYWNNVSNIPGKWVYWNFLGRGTFGNVGVIVYGSGDGSESLAGEYNNQMKIITTVDMEGDEGEVINAMGKGKSSTKFKGTKGKFSNKTIFKAVNKALKASMNSNGDYVPSASQKNNLTDNALIPLEDGNFQVYFRTSGLDGTEIYKTNYTITPEQASQGEFQGFTFPSGATENDVVEFFNIENKAAGLDGVTITTP